MPLKQRSQTVKDLKQGAYEATKFVVPASLTALATASAPAIVTVPAVGAVVAGTGALSYLIDKHNKGVKKDEENLERLRRAQKAVLAENGLLVMQDHKGNTKYVGLPEDMSEGQHIHITEPKHSLQHRIATRGQKMVDTTSRSIQGWADKVSEDGTLGGIAGGLATYGLAYGAGIVRRGYKNLENKAANSPLRNMIMVSSGGEHQKQLEHFSEGKDMSEQTYMVAIDLSTSDGLKSLGDVYTQVDPNNSLKTERLKDMMGESLFSLAERISDKEKEESHLEPDVAYVTEGRFSEAGDFGILGTIAGKGASALSSIAKATVGDKGGINRFTSTVKSILPGEKGRNAAVELVSRSGSNMKKITDKLSGSIDNAFKDASPDSVTGKIGKVASGTVESIGNLYKSGTDAVASNPAGAQRVVRAVAGGSGVAGAVATGVMAGKSSEKRQQEVKTAPNATVQNTETKKTAS